MIIKWHVSSTKSIPLFYICLFVRLGIIGIHTWQRLKKFCIFIKTIPVIKMHKLYHYETNRDYINDFRTAD